MKDIDHLDFVSNGDVSLRNPSLLKIILQLKIIQNL